MIAKALEKLTNAIKLSQADIYNEFSLQHELGIILRGEFPNNKVQFERNVSYFFRSGDFIKKEIDISIFTSDKSQLRYAIEIKFPRNGQYPEQMFQFCKDIRFAEQLKQAGFEKACLVIFADDPQFYDKKRIYSGSGNDIYSYFRQGANLCGTIRKPTGKKDEKINLAGSYHVQWKNVTSSLQYALIEAVTN